MKLYRDLMNFLRDHWANVRTILVGLVLVLVIAFLHPSNPSYAGVNPNPYFIIAIVMGAFLGLKNTVLVTPIISATYLVALRVKTDMDAVETFYSLQTFILPAAILIIPTMIAVITDSLRTKVKDIELDLQSRSNSIQELERMMAQIRNESLQIERQFGVHLQSITRIFEYAQILETLDPIRISKGIVDLACEQLGEDNCYVYMITEDGLSRGAYRDTQSDVMPEYISFENLKKYPLINRSYRTREISRVEDLSQKDIEESFPSQEGYFGLAMPLLSGMNQIVGIIFLKRLHFLNYIPVTFTTFRALGSWAGICLSRAIQVQATHRDTYSDDVTGLFTYAYLLKRLENEFKQAKKYNIPLYLLQFNISEIQKIDPIKRLALIRLVAHCIDLFRSEVDVISLGAEEGSFFVMITFLTEQEIEVFKKKVLDEFEELKKHFDAGMPLKLKCTHMGVSVEAENHLKITEVEKAW